MHLVKQWVFAPVFSCVCVCVCVCLHACDGFLPFFVHLLTVSLVSLTCIRVCSLPLSSGGEAGPVAAGDAAQQRVAGGGGGGAGAGGALHHHHPLLEALPLREAGVPARCHEHYHPATKGQGSCQGGVTQRLQRSRAICLSVGFILFELNQLC